MAAINTKLCFFRNLNNPKEYFLRLYSEYEVYTKLDCFNHRNGQEGSGYRHYDCELAAKIEIPEELKWRNDEYARFILRHIGKRTRDDDKFLDEWGWYEIDLANADNWPQLYDSYKKKLWEDRRQAEMKNTGIQTSLF